MLTFTQNERPLVALTGQALPPVNFEKMIGPATPLEAALLKREEFKTGLNWGVPRFGHPEGKVGFHVVEVLGNVSSLVADQQTVSRLRLAALAHDTFKYKEAETLAHGKKINHGLIARRFMENILDDEGVLDLIELHDEIYYAWRYEALQRNPAKAQACFDGLLDRVGENFKLHYYFFRCDTMTGDKIQAPIHWLERKINEADQSVRAILINGH